MVDRLRKELGEFLIIEDLKRTAGRNLANSRGVETVVVVTIARLNENGRIGKTFGVHFTSDVV
jgi:hypothetical protein